MHPASPHPPCPPREAWQPAASGSLRRLAGFLRVLDVDAVDAHRHAASFEQIREGTLGAVVVHGVMRQDEIAELLHAAEHAEPPLPQSSFPAPFRSRFLGRNLNLMHPALEAYFEEAATFNAQLAALPPSPEGLVARVTALLSALDRGARFEAAPGPAPGLRYMFTTLRDHRPGGFIPPHFDNEMRLRPSYRHLSTLVNQDLLSFVLALSCAEAGGALEVFDLRCTAAQARLISDDRVTDPPSTANSASVTFRLPPGSLIVLDSGRLLHQLTTVHGAVARRTVCSFMARSLACEAINYCWG